VTNQLLIVRFVVVPYVYRSRCGSDGSVVCTLALGNRAGSVRQGYRAALYPAIS